MYVEYLFGKDSLWVESIVPSSFRHRAVWERGQLFKSKNVAGPKPDKKRGI